MSRGKYLSLEEARNMGKLDRFAKERELNDPRPDGWDRFWNLMEAATGSPGGGGTSGRAASEGYSDTRTRQGTSEDASD